ncbi:MAG: DNA repair protein RecN [Alphaproteobacteria bacterium]|nr:DNA repair protein RecN [Alphaproteobacteria bacterium]
MLTALRIHNVVLIEALEIDFRKGLCALTGETGAGKSILLDSLGLAIGARADSALVRKGAEQAQVSATFEISPEHPAYEILTDADITVEQGEDLILRRSLTPDGRSKAYINDQSVSAGLMRSVGDTLIEIHGQFDTQGLLNPSTHRHMLDEYAGIPASPLKSWDAWQDAVREMEALKQRTSASKTEEAYLREALEDLDKLDPQAGEEEELAGLRERLMNREQVLEGLNAAYNALNGEHDPVRSAWGTLERISDKIGPQADPIIDALDRASSEIQDAVANIQSLSADLTETEHDLESIDDRLFGLRGQARKHNCEVDELPQIREQLAQQLNDIEHADDALADAIKKVEQAKAAYEKEAQSVHEKRKAAAMKLDGLVAQELPPLKLEKARFETHIEILPEDDWGPHGMDRVRFLVATNPGAEAGPLNKIASGGEMSRFMLALKVVMAEVGTADTLIFDEVDAGIGGGTADAVGERLGRLASDKQILVVTHAPQVAARAGYHWIVQKDGDDVIRTSIIPLEDPQARREEIARMLAGATITEEARAAANKLLELGVAA